MSFINKDGIVSLNMESKSVLEQRFEQIKKLKIYANDLKASE